MVIDFVLGVLIVVGLAALFALVIRKIPILRITNPSEVGKFEQQQVRQQLVLNRLKRNWLKIKQKTSSLFSKSTNKSESNNKSITEKLSELEDFLKQTIADRTSPERSLADYLQEAEEAIKNEDYEVAEEAYLEVLKIDPHQLSAYQGLGDVYLEQRDFEAAREVYEFLLKHGRAATSSLGLARVATGQGRLEEAREEYIGALQLTSTAQPRLELAQILRETGDYKESLKYLKEARKIEPQNPKILDFFIEVSILNGQPNQAREGLDALREANPENQKIAEFAREIRSLEQKQKPKPSRSGRSGGRGKSFGLPTGKR